MRPPPPAQTRGGRQGRVRPVGGRERCVLLLAGPRQRLPQPERTDGERRPRGVVVRDGRGPQPFDEFAADAGVDRRGQPQPQARQARRQQRNRDQPPAEPALPRVLAHDVAVRDHVRPSHLEPAPLAVRQVEHRHEIRHEVGEGDGLGRRAHPGRADHDREPLDEDPDQLEREAAGPEHDAAPHLDDGHRRRAQHLAGLVPAAQVPREPGLGPEAADVDDAADSGRPRRRPEVAGRVAVLRLEVGAAPHRVDQVVGGVDARERGLQRGRVEAVAVDGLVAEAQSAREGRRPARHAAQGVTARLERRSIRRNVLGLDLFRWLNYGEGGRCTSTRMLPPRRGNSDRQPNRTGLGTSGATEILAGSANATGIPTRSEAIPVSERAGAGAGMEQTDEAGWMPCSRSPSRQTSRCRGTC